MPTTSTEWDCRIYYRPRPLALGDEPDCPGLRRDVSCIAATPLVLRLRRRPEIYLSGSGSRGVSMNAEEIMSLALELAGFDEVPADSQRYTSPEKT